MTAVRYFRRYSFGIAAIGKCTADFGQKIGGTLLDRMDDTDSKVCYLKAMVLSRLGQTDEAMKYFELALAYDPYLEHRANLDPEMYVLVNKYKQSKIN
jgi:tetratricopeptide (TPR) repeat protein